MQSLHACREPQRYTCGPHRLEDTQGLVRPAPLARFPHPQKPLRKSRDEAQRIDPEKPHPQELCEKCQQLGYYCRNARGGSGGSDDDDDDDGGGGGGDDDGSEYEYVITVSRDAGRYSDYSDDD